MLFHDFSTIVSYNSFQHLVEFLGARDETIATEALNCLHSLVILPSAHRCEKYLAKVMTSLHKSPHLFHFIFEMFDASYIGIPWKTALQEDFSPPAFVAKISLSSESSESEVPILDNLYVDVRSVQEIVESASSFNLSGMQKCTLAWIIRLRRLLLTVDGRRNLLELQLKLASVLLSHPDKSLLFKFFHDKLDFLKDLAWLLSISPDDNELYESDMLICHRIHAIQCVSGMFESRDASSPPMVMHFPWLLDILGVSRGQYMGTIPNLIRYSVSWLLTRPAAPHELDGKKEANVILWIENLLFLVSIMASFSSALPALADNGLVDSLLSIISSMQTNENGNENDLLLFIHTLSMDILIVTFRNYPTSLNLFQEKCGVEAVINRLNFRLQSYLTISPDAALGPSPQKLLIQYYLTILSTYVQECQNDYTNGEEQQFQEFYLNKSFTGVIELIFAKTDFFSTIIIALVFNLLTEMINKDPSPPTILNSLLTSTEIIEKGLSIFGLNHKIVSLDHDLLTIILSFVSSISISKDGIALVTKSRIIHKVFAFYLQDQFFYPKSLDLMSQELSVTFGKNLEQLIRHYPTYLTAVFDSLTRFLNLLVDRADIYCDRLESKKIQLSTSPNDFLTFEEEFAKVMNSVIGLATCLEQLLEKKSYLKEFLTRNNGLALLSKLKVLSFGPLKSFLVWCSANQTLTDDFRNLPVHHLSTPSTVGHPTLDGIVHRCFEKILVFFDAKTIFDFSLEQVTVSLSKLEDSLTTYRGIHSLSGHQMASLKGEPANVDVAPVGDESLLTDFLDSVSEQPLHEIADAAQLPLQLQHYASVLKNIALLDFFIELLGMSFTTSSRYGRANSAINTECIRKLASNEDIMVKLNTLLQKYHFPIQAALSSWMQSETLNPVRSTNHPNYILRVLSDHVVVRDSCEESGKRLYKLPKGCHVVATERKVTAPNSVKYRIADGWISQFRGQNLGMMGNDQLFIVVDVVNKAEPNLEICDCLSVLSARKGGVHVFQRFHKTIKHVIFSLLPKLLIIQDTDQDLPLFSRRLDDSPVVHCVHGLLPFFSQTFDLLLPLLDQRVVCSVDDAFRDYPSSDTAEVDGQDESDVTTFIRDRFVSTEIWKFPSIDKFPLKSLFSVSRLADLCQSLLADPRPGLFGHHGAGTNDANNLLLIRFFYEKDLFTRFLDSTMNVILCAFNPFKAPHFPSLDGGWRAFPEDWLSIPDSALDQIANRTEKEWDSYLAARRHNEKRREQASEFAPKVIDMWKTLLISLSTPPTPFEKTLLEGGTKERDFSPEVFKRTAALTLFRFLSAIWLHPLFVTLPPQISRGLLELFCFAPKALKALISFPLKSSRPSTKGKSGESRKKKSTEVSAVSREWLTPRNIFGMLRNSAVAFEPSEDVLTLITEMGFTRQEGLIAARTLHSNDLEQLVPYLLEHAGSMVIPQSEAEATSASTAIRSENTESVDANSSVLANSVEAESNSIPAAENKFHRDSDSEEEQEESSVSPLLPVIILSPEKTLILQKEFLPKFSRYLMRNARAMYLSTLHASFNSDVSPGNNRQRKISVYSRESSVLLVMQTFLKFFDGTYQLSESALRLLQLCWLIEESLSLLAKPSLDYLQVNSVLQAILVLFTSKITGGSTIKSISDSRDSNSSGLELILSSFRFDPRFLQFKKTLISHLSKLADDLPGNKLEESTIAFLNISLLLLDVLGQTFVVDRESLSSQLNEIDSLLQANSNNIFDLTVLWDSQEQLVHESVRRSIMQSHSPTVTDLPLWSPADPQEDDLECTRVCSKLLAICSSPSLSLKEVKEGEKDDSLSLEGFLRSLLQLTVHLEAKETARSFLFEQKTSLTVLNVLSNCPSYLKNLQILVQTLFQRQFEDYPFLEQMMFTTMKIVYEKLSASHHITTSTGTQSRATLSRFLEAVAPLVLRNQTIFLQVLLEHFDLLKEHGVILLKLKPSFLKEPEDQMKPIKSESPARLQASQRHDPVAIRHKRNALLQETVESLCNQIVEKSAAWFEGDDPETISKNLESIRVAINLLDLLADLVANLPICGLFVSRYRASVAHAKKIASIVAFLIHRVMFSTTTVDSTEENVGKPQPLRKEVKRLGEELFDRISYFLAALMFRPGEGRKLVLDEIHSILYSVHVDGLRAFVAEPGFERLLHACHKFIHPPSSWVARETFSLPVKEIVQALSDRRIYAKLLDIFSKLDLEKFPLKSKSLETMAWFFDSFIRKSAALSVEVSLEVEPTSSKRKSELEAHHPHASAVCQATLHDDQEEFGLAAYDDMVSSLFLSILEFNSLNFSRNNAVRQRIFRWENWKKRSPRHQVLRYIVLSSSSYPPSRAFHSQLHDLHWSPRRGFAQRL